MPSDQHLGNCFCGAIEISATGAPFAMGYCHCKNCRAWSAGPVNAFTLWQTDAVSVTKGNDSLASYTQSGSTHRKYCRKCGGNIMAIPDDGSLVDVFAAILPSVEFKPDVHVNYESAVIKIKDGLPKLKDFPAEWGGSGETMPE